MSDDNLQEVIEHNPQLRKRRTRTRPMHDYKAMAEQQAETLKSLQEQNEKLVGLITSGKTGTGNPLAMFLPPKPIPVKRPTGFQYLVSRIPEHQNDDNEKISNHVIVVPERPDNPNEPDPRYCVFCMIKNPNLLPPETYEDCVKRANIAEFYGRKDIPGNPNEEQMAALTQLFQMHQSDMVAKSGSRRKGAAGKDDKRVAANHLEMKAVKFGRVPDEIAWLKGKTWTTEEYNEKELKEWEAKCRSIGLGMAQGGI